MKLKKLTQEQIDTYIEVGKRSYYQHYLYLWQQGNPEPYISSSFTREVVLNELKDPNLVHFLVTTDQATAGIIKIVVDAAYGNYTESQALLLEKIYLLAEFSGQGLGTKCLDLISDYARSMGKGMLWLDTMQTGRALPFYLAYGFEIIGEKELEFEKVLESEKPMYILGLQLS